MKKDFIQFDQVVERGAGMDFHKEIIVVTIRGQGIKTYLSSKYKSLVGRRDKKRAVIAVGHKILIAAYFIIKNKVGYNELGEDYLSNFRKDKLVE